jgi:RNA-binding protein
VPVTLTPRERAHLKARAHALEPRVQVGHAGATPAVTGEVERALAAHELIKVKILDADRQVRAEIAEALCAKTDAALVQSVGKVFVLWRPKPDEPGGQPDQSRNK